AHLRAVLRRRVGAHMKTKELVFSTVTIVIATVVALGMAEVILRVKNSAMDNYDIEMWKYGRALKVRSANPILSSEHIPNAAALLESVELRTNSWGLRGGPVRSSDPPARRILTLGASITMGWGVDEKNVFTTRLQDMFAARGEDVEILNA